MKKLISAAVAIIILLSFCFIPVSAEEMPDWWFPNGTDNFQNFHGEDLPRVVDDADLITDEQEAELSAEIQEIVDAYNIGYVIFTDNDNHGLSPEQYSADFLYSNGYGVGDDFSAVVFYISMEEDNRCWRTTSINGCEKIFTQSITYTIDELIDSDIRDRRDFYSAFKKHVAFVDKLMSNLTDLPDWYPDGADFSVYADEDALLSDKLDLSKPRVNDIGGYFTEEQVKKYSDKLKQLSEKYNYDLILFTDNDCHALSNGKYADDFYCYNNYYKDGLIFYLITDQYEGGEYFYYGYLDYGEFYNKYDEKNILSAMKEKGGYETGPETVEVFLEILEFLLEHDRFPISGSDIKDILLAVGVGLLIAMIISAIRLQVLKRQMRVSNPISAGVYLVPDSFKLRDKSVDYLYTTVTKVAKPKDSGGSGGGSSYSSGSSSGGGSYSSGGRSF